MNKYIFLFLIVVFMNSCAAGAYEDEAVCNRQKAGALLVLAISNPENISIDGLTDILLISYCTDLEKKRRSYNE